MNHLLVLKSEATEGLRDFLLKTDAIEIEKNVYIVGSAVEAVVLAQKICKKFPKVVCIKGFRYTDELNLSKSEILNIYGLT